MVRHGINDPFGRLYNSLYKMCWVIMNCFASLIALMSPKKSQGGGWSGGGCPPPQSSARIAAGQPTAVSIQASSNNQLLLNNFQREMTQYMLSRGTPVSINGVYNPSQPNLEVVVMQNGSARGTTFIGQTQLQAEGYTPFVQQVYKMLWEATTVLHEEWFCNLVKELFGP